MTGDCHGDWIRGNRSGDGADGFGFADAGGNFGIGGGGAGGDFAEGLPNALLEGGATNVQRELASGARLFDETDDLRHEAFEISIAADQIRLAKTALQISGEFVRVITDQDGAH